MICNRCEKNFKRAPRSKAKLCNDCWFARYSERKKPNIEKRVESKSKIDKRIKVPEFCKCETKGLTYAKGLCYNCYQKQRKEINRNKI